MSTPESDRDTLLGTILEQARDSIRSGQHDLDLEGILSHHPELADELPALVDTLRELETSVEQWRWLAGMTQTWTAPTLRVHPPGELPARLGRYRILGRIGAGGMGTVYRAFDPHLHRDVAIKVPHLDGYSNRQQIVDRFQREARAAARVQHPHIVPIHDVGEDAGQPFVVMDYIAGTSLADRLRNGNRLGSDREAVSLVRQVAEALSALHKQGIIHRDLKPANILLDSEGRALLTDFGLARPEVATGHLSQAGTVLGTPAYMSPEQAGGEHDCIGPWSDLYSLGVILYELLTGRLPFDGPTLAVLVRLRSETPPPPSSHRRDLDPALEAIVLRLLAQRPEDRYPSADVLLDHLANWQTGTVPPPAPSPVSGKTPAKVRVELPDGTPVHVTVDVPAGAKQVGVQVRERPAKKNRPKQLAVMVTITLGLLLLVGTTVLRLEQPRQADEGWKHARASLTRIEEKLSIDGHTRGVRSVAFSPDGKSIVSGSGNTLKVWDAVTGREKLSLAGRAGWVHSVAFSPDGKRILCGSDAQTLKVWDATSGRPVRELKGHPAPINCVVMSLDSNRVVSARDTSVQLWDLDTGRQLRELRSHPQPIRCVAMSPNGKRIVAASDKLLKVWDAETGRELLSLKGHSAEATCMAFSPDGKQIVSGSADQTLKVWDAVTGQEMLLLKGHTDDVLSVAFSPDGKQIVSGSADQTLRVWDAVTGEEMLSLKGHTGGVLSVAFSPDGQCIASGSVDTTVKVWQRAASR